MPPRHRKSAMRVRDGQVAKKNNWVADYASIKDWVQTEIRIERRDPGPGYRHLLTVADLRTFLDLLPDWDEVSAGLSAIVLDEGGDNSMGWHDSGVVAVCAWERDLWDFVVFQEWVDEHRTILDLLGVESAATDVGVRLRWTEAQARAFQLLHVLPHELGHHHDRITTSSGVRPGRGEPYAEQYANSVLDVLWPTYATHFPI